MDRALYQVVYLWLDIQCAVHSVSHYDITEIMYKWSLKCAASLWLIIKCCEQVHAHVVFPLMPLKNLAVQGAPQEL